MLKRMRFALIAGTFVLARSTDAQVAPVAVQGIAFDSLRGQPLPEALVVVVGMTHTARTDARGRFRFDSVPLGVHTLIVQHPVLDSIGFTGLSRQIDLATATGDVTIGVPSFATLWRLACGDTPAPKDSGFVYGTIRQVTNGAPAPDAFVDLTWIDLSYKKSDGLKRWRVRGETRSDSTGTYTVCGVPPLQWLRVDAGMASGASGHVDMPPTELRVQRRDLLIGSTTEPDGPRRGVIVGLLTGMDGEPFGNARVLVDDTAEVRTGWDGRFIMRDVPVGTRQVEVLSLGMMPVVTAVDVFPNDTAMLGLRMRKVTTLDVVRVTASTRGRVIAQAFEERRRIGSGYSMEVGEIVAHATMSTVFNSFPGARVEQRTGDFLVLVPDGRGGLCPPDVWIDGARMEYAALNMLRPRDVIAVELFPRASTVPIEYRRNERNAGCGAILVWTGRSFK